MRQSFVYLGVPGDGFPPLAIGPDIVASPVAEEPPAPFPKRSLQLLSLHVPNVHRCVCSVKGGSDMGRIPA
jgi:hypothetical protein